MHFISSTSTTDSSLTSDLMTQLILWILSACLYQLSVAQWHSNHTQDNMLLNSRHRCQRCTKVISTLTAFAVIYNFLKGKNWTNFASDPALKLVPFWITVLESESTNDHMTEQSSLCSDDCVHNHKDRQADRHQLEWKKSILCFHKQTWVGVALRWQLFCALKYY